MRSIRKWRVVLMIAVIVIAIPIAARVRVTPDVLVERQANVYPQAAAYSEVAKTIHTANSKAAVARRVAPPQDYYDRRRDHWEERMERRADGLEQEDGDDKDDADSDDVKDSKKSSSDDDEVDSMDDEEEMIRKRRDYWRQRLDRDW